MLAAERGAAANTIAAYRRDLEDAVAFFANRGLAETAASADDLRDYLARLNRAGMAPTTTARRLSALRQFYRFLFAEGVRLDDPTGVIDSPRRGRTLPRSEEHTSELQSLMRTSYAVFCLQKKKT